MTDLGVAEGERDGDAIYLLVLEEVTLKRSLPERREVVREMMILGGKGEMWEFTIRDKHTMGGRGKKAINLWEREFIGKHYINIVILWWTRHER